MYKRNKVCDVVVTASLINIYILLTAAMDIKLLEEEKATPKLTTDNDKQYISLSPNLEERLDRNISFAFKERSRMSPTV